MNGYMIYLRTPGFINEGNTYISEDFITNILSLNIVSIDVDQLNNKINTIELSSEVSANIEVLETPEIVATRYIKDIVGVKDFVVSDFGYMGKNRSRVTFVNPNNEEKILILNYIVQVKIILGKYMNGLMLIVKIIKYKMLSDHLVF